MSPTPIKDPRSVTICLAKHGAMAEVKMLSKWAAFHKLKANIRTAGQPMCTEGKLVLVGAFPGYTASPVGRVIKEETRWVARASLLAPPYSDAWAQGFCTADRAAANIMREMAELPPPVPVGFTHSVVNLAAAMTYIDAAVKHKGEVALWLDIETTDLDPHVGELASIAIEASCHLSTITVLGRDDTQSLLKYVAKSGLGCYGANMKFEQYWTIVKCGVELRLAGDVQVDYALLFEENLKGLDSMAGIVGLYGYESEMESFLKPIKGRGLVRISERRRHHEAPASLLARYNALDTKVSRVIGAKLAPWLESHPGNAVDHARWLVRGQTALARMQARGLCLDKRLVLKTVKDYATSISEMETSLQAMARKKGCKKPIDFASPQSKAELFYDIMKLPVMKLTNGEWRRPDRYAPDWWKGVGTPSTDAEALALVKEMVPENQFVGYLLELNRLKALSAGVLTHCESAVMGGDGFMRSDFSLTKLVTGQISSSNPPVQNIARGELRKMFVSRFKNGSIVELDYSQLHLRIIGNLSQCEGFISAYAKGVDMHSRTAANVVLEEPEDRFLKALAKGDSSKEEARDLAKRVNFSIIFEIGPKALAIKTGKSVEYCKQVIARWLGFYPEIREQIERQHAFAAKHGYVISPFGRVRHLPGAQHRDRMVQLRAFRQAGDFLVSNAGRMINLYAMIELDDALTLFYDSMVVSQVHDSIILDVHPDEKEDVLNLAKKHCVDSIMENCADWMDPIPVEVEGFAGPNWYKKDKHMDIKITHTEGVEAVSV